MCALFVPCCILYSIYNSVSSVFFAGPIHPYPVAPLGGDLWHRRGPCAPNARVRTIGKAHSVGLSVLACLVLEGWNQISDWLREIVILRFGE